MRISALIAALIGALTLAAPAVAHAGCEQDVVAECVAHSCPAFCKTQHDAAACQKGCTAADRCKLSLGGGRDRRDQVELDIQDREELMECLAENRRPVVFDASLGHPILVDDDEALAAEAAEHHGKPAPVKGAAPKGSKPHPPAAAPPPRASHGSLKDAQDTSAGWKKAQTHAFAAHQSGTTWSAHAHDADAH